MKRSWPLLPFPGTRVNADCTTKPQKLQAGRKKPDSRRGGPGGQQCQVNWGLPPLLMAREERAPRRTSSGLVHGGNQNSLRAPSDAEMSRDEDNDCPSHSGIHGPRRVSPGSFGHCLPPSPLKKTVVGLPWWRSG